MATTRATSIYNMYDYRRYMDNDGFRVIMDMANQKYNKPGLGWRMLGEWDQPSDSRVWSQGQRTVPIMARASLLSAHGLKPMRSTSGWKFYTGSTPKFGHGYTFGEDDMFLLRDVRNNTGRSVQELMFESMLLNSEIILGGIHNELSHMTFELASTGGINEASVDGVKYEFKFDFDDNQYQTVSPAWFSEASGGAITPITEDVNVIDDILQLQNLFTETQNREVNTWLVNKDTLNRILDHPSVRSAYLANKNVQSAYLSSYVTTRVEMINFLYDRGVWPIVPVDFKSVHEVDGVPVADDPAFDPRYLVAFNRNERMFTIKNTNSIWKDRQAYGGISQSTMYSFIEGRIAALSTWQENPIHNNVEFELYAGPVFRNMRNWGRVKLYSHYGE